MSNDDAMLIASAKAYECFHCMIRDVCTQVIQEGVRPPPRIVEALLDVAAELIASYYPSEAHKADPEGPSRFLSELIENYLNESRQRHVH